MDEAVNDVSVKPSEPKQETKPRRQPPHAIVLFNDEDHTFPYVIEVLCKVFGHSVAEAERLTLEVHRRGRGIVWTGTKELAELKCEQVHGYGPDVYAAKSIAYPLQVAIEPMPE